MTLTVLTPQPQQWDAFVHARPRAHALQLSGWAGLKRPYGWGSARVALADKTGALVAGAQMLLRPLPLRLGTMAYLPFGPILTHYDQRDALWDAIHAAARGAHASFLKWEPGFLLDGAAPPDFSRYGFRESAQTIQPPRTVMIDIRPDEDAILARMNQGTRRKIRQSLKGDVRYVQATRDQVRLFTDMMQTTGARNAFGVHEPSYYGLAYDLFVPHSAALFLALLGDEPLAGVMAFAQGDMAYYLYGASSNQQRNLMASYGAQWQAIQWAKSRGCAWYDMWGVPDEDAAVLEAGFESRDDGLWGVYGFKRGWGGEVMRSLGAWDHVYNPLIYGAYRLALQARRAGNGD
ncbi:MAG: peptidoglycan bridge formation glycyltransferase FemA/FemB family protein [Pleurocapsa minor GSE-CHR-MK-17-07R]|jgi:lipid II:glycine glycyltransferase (peptidoglycan interpeptide bridge formation enzyme)|nr:peptidoglycan bridge formation glycyltransferase FemA/FemB family protein [Pleurocapsa minor GSE-CHR-MK 17-07R]